MIVAKKFKVHKINGWIKLLSAALQTLAATNSYRSSAELTTTGK